jgi:thioredoxin reductase (NADPH)
MEAILDDRPVSAELQTFLKELAGMTDKLTLVSRRIALDEDPLLGSAHTPFVELRYADGRSSGVVFHGIPGGHETTSFILAIYNVSGPGQALAPELANEIAALTRPTHLTTLVSLSCTNCPDVVQATQRIAALNPLVRAEAYDLRLYPNLQKRYKVMSVPCLIIEQEGCDEQIVFGKRQLPQILKLLR